MRLQIILAGSALLAACGQSHKEQLQDAANQSDPAAAEVLENAAENGMNPQEALQEAGNAAVEANTAVTPPSGPARPSSAEEAAPAPGGAPDRKETPKAQ